MNNKQKFVSAAIAGILGASTVMAQTGGAAPAAAPAKGQCQGANACKGKSACMGAHNKCAGQNACAGKGWTEAADAKACEAEAKTNKAKHHKFVAADNVKKEAAKK